MVFAHSGNCAKQSATWITPMPGQRISYNGCISGIKSFFYHKLDAGHGDHGKYGYGSAAQYAGGNSSQQGRKLGNQSCQHDYHCSQSQNHAVTILS